MTDYTTLLHRDALHKAEQYLQALRSGQEPGQFLAASLIIHQLDALSLAQFLELLVQTKHPQIFAESSVAGDGSDWNQSELSILGDISIAIPVNVFDNGLHANPDAYETPLQATLLFTPGALLRNGRGVAPADWDEVVSNEDIDTEGFYRLYKRRLLPPLLYASQTASKENRKAFVTVPGLGCGQFAGPFRGLLGEKLKTVLMRLLDSHHDILPGIRAIYFDPYSECENEFHEFGNTSLLVRPLTRGNVEKPQLCRVQQYQEHREDFSHCDLFSVVAWDHVSWPGNDFFIGSRYTDDGVKAAATNSMEVLTGIAGSYDKNLSKYLPPSQYKSWGEVVTRNKLQLEIKNTIQIHDG